MSDSFLSQLPQIARSVVDTGWAFTPNFLTAEEVRSLQEEARQKAGEFRQAGVGRGGHKAVRAEIRTDHIFWLQADEPNPVIQRYFAFVEQLRQTLNQELFLGAFEFEAHLATFPVGSYYKRHLDCFAEQPRRVVSCILYLNNDWLPEDGGALRLYIPKSENPRPDAPEEEALDFLPHGGGLMIFLSALFPHEVLETRRERLSLTGWLCLKG